jgi:hypothetical protein
MSSMCYWLLGTARCEITGAPRCAHCATPLRNNHADVIVRHLERGADTVRSRCKNQVGQNPEELLNGTRTLRRYARRTIVEIRHQPRRNAHTAIGWGHSGGRAIGHTDLGCSRSGEGTRVDSQGFQLSNAWARVSSQGAASASRPAHTMTNPCQPLAQPRTQTHTVGRPELTWNAS